MYVFLRVAATHLADGYRLPPRVKLGEECHVHPVTIAKAWARTDFRTWFEQQLGLDADTLGALIKRRVAGQALAGSEKHQRLWFELVGDLRRGTGVDEVPGKAGWTVNILNVPASPPPDPITVGSGATAAAGGA